MTFSGVHSEVPSSPLELAVRLFARRGAEPVVRVGAGVRRWARRESAASPGSRHFLFTWLKTQGIDDTLIQPYSGHASRVSLEIYSRLALSDAQAQYEAVIDRFPV